MDDQNKNLILATALSFLVILTWFILFPPEDPSFQPGADGQTATLDADGSLTPPAATTGTGGTTATIETPAEVTDAPRVTVDTPHLVGSISLQGGRIDDLELVEYRETLDEGADRVHLFNPVGTTRPDARTGEIQSVAYYTLYGWAGPADTAVPNENTIWSIESGETLTPETPITLIWDNEAGLIFRREISVDVDYMFTINQRVENNTGTAVSLAPYGIVARHGEPQVEGFFISHEGVVRMVDGEREPIKYNDMPDFTGGIDTVQVQNSGWVGFVDKYWMATLIPEQGTPFTASARYIAATNIYRTEVGFPELTVEPGGTAEASSQLFAGAKEWETIRNYQNEDGIDRFLDSIDWGWFFFLTKPIFWLLHNINAVVGNMGWSIIGLTLVIKSLLLPLAWKSAVSMAKMKELQPEMEKLKESAGEDRQKMQQGMMKLYKDNKVNPASGCVPILLQIPIFFSLYKVIFVTLELRHAPWVGWINDLSAPDPSSIFNLFGLLPWAGGNDLGILSIFALGILPIILGISMWLQQKLNPSPTDPTQKMIFAWMPWVFMFMLGSFASGLVLYWIANNIITFTQQYLIMRKNGHKPDVFGNISASFKREAKVEAANSDEKPKGKK